MRVFSFAVESTRYCNYSKNKFNNEITYILPPWMDEAQLGTHDPKEIIKQANGFNEWANDEDISEIVFLLSLARAEEAYLGLINTGWQPQQARNILPLATKCEMIMTGFASDWTHFFSLRCPSSAHPQARELAIPLMEEFKNKGYVI